MGVHPLGKLLRSRSVRFPDGPILLKLKTKQKQKPQTTIILYYQTPSLRRLHKKLMLIYFRTYFQGLCKCQPNFIIGCNIC